MQNRQIPRTIPDIGTEILQWSKDRPAWQRDALRRLFDSNIGPHDIVELVAICKAAHGLHPAVSYQPLDDGHISIPRSAAQATNVWSITHRRGVNALAPDQTVTFGPALTIVYGQNAAGKSGYTRILKRVCRSRSAEKILGNVLSGAAPGKPKATITYRNTEVDSVFEWEPDIAVPVAQSAVSVFDSHCAPVYLRDKTDVAFRPFGLDIFDKLSVLCAQVRSELELERIQLANTAKSLPDIAPGTKVRSLLDTLNQLTKPEAVRALANLSIQETNRLKELRDQRRELRASNPKKVSRDLALRAERIESLGRHLTQVAEAFGGSRMVRLHELAGRLRTAQTTLATLRTTTMPSDLLQGTGEDVWKRMWLASREFSAAVARSFPPSGEGAVCPLCQQSIGEAAERRMKHLAEYVDSTAQQQVDQAITAFETATRPMLSISVGREDIVLATDELATDDEALSNRIRIFLANANGCKRRSRTR